MASSEDTYDDDYNSGQQLQDDLAGLYDPPEEETEEECSGSDSPSE